MSTSSKSQQPDKRGAVDRVRAHAEFMRVWDEGYVADSATFVAMHVQGVAVLSGGVLRSADGLLDRAAITAWVAAATSGVPYARLRLMRSPLGITAPAWVPDESFDAARHLRFSDAPVSHSADTVAELIGWNAGPLDLDRPLWRLQFTALEDGRVAMGLLMHHSSGDALRTLKLLSALTGNDPEAIPQATADPFETVRAPRRGGELALIALRSWLGEGSGTGERWREYWRKPLHRRLRRVGSRMLRPVRESRTKGTTRQARRAGFFTVPSELVQDHAAGLGATLNDLVVAASLRAGEDGIVVPSVRVPVMRRRSEDSRNRVADLRIAGGAGESFAELVESVRAQLRGESDRSATPSDEIGYATLVPWLSRPRYLLGARLDELIVLPAASPDDALSTFSLLYDGMLTVVATTPAFTEIDPLMGRLREAMTGAAA